MKESILNKKFKHGYDAKMTRLFRFRVDLFCYTAILVFLLEGAFAFTVFRGLLGIRDIPGMVIGTFFSIILLATGNFRKSLFFQKGRAFFFSLLLILISILAATAHPVLISHMGITLVLMAYFSSVLLLPWNLIETSVIGVFTLVNFIWVYLASGTFVSEEVFGINIILLVIAVILGAMVKRSEDILRQRDFSFQKEIEEKNAIMAKELDLAKKIHRDLMPRSIKHELAEIAVTYRPVFYMGGDYAKFHFYDENSLMFMLTDVTGHGVSAALMVNRMHSEVERLVRERLSPGDMLKALDKFINEGFGRQGIFLTAFCAMLDFSSGKLTYSNYGHPPQILIQSKENRIMLLESQTFMMGVGMDDGGIYTSDVRFERGDRLILFTDGIVESSDKSGEFFGQERLQLFARENAKLDVEGFNEKLLKNVNDFQFGEQSDDIFLLTVQTK